MRHILKEHFNEKVKTKYNLSHCKGNNCNENLCDFKGIQFEDKEKLFTSK